MINDKIETLVMEETSIEVGQRNHLKARKMTIDVEFMKLQIDSALDIQTQLYGRANDAVDHLQLKFDQSKENNAQLMASIQQEKQTFERMEDQLQELRKQLLRYRRTLGSMRSEQSLELDAKELEKWSEDRHQRVSKINQDLLTVSLPQNMYSDIKDKPRLLTTSKVSPKPRRPINAVAIRKRLTSQKLAWN